MRIFDLNVLSNEYRNADIIMLTIINILLVLSIALHFYFDLPIMACFHDILLYVGYLFCSIINIISHSLAEFAMRCVTMVVFGLAYGVYFIGNLIYCLHKSLIHYFLIGFTPDNIAIEMIDFSEEFKIALAGLICLPFRTFFFLFTGNFTMYNTLLWFVYTIIEALFYVVIKISHVVLSILSGVIVIVLLPLSWIVWLVVSIAEKFVLRARLPIVFDSTQTIYHMYGFSEPASDRMYVAVEMYHNTVVMLSYIFTAIILIIYVIINLFKADTNSHVIPFNKRVEYILDALFVFVPIIIVYYLTVPAVSFVLSNDRSMTFIDTLFSIEIVGHQWYWTYYIHGIESSFLEELVHIVVSDDLAIDSTTFTLEFDQMIDNETDFLTRCFEVNKHLVLPVQEHIRCFVTSEDVIHSWALPQMGIKIDAVPGRVQVFVLHAIKTGVFYGQCSELCGVNHAFMPIAVEIVELESFFDWLIKETQNRYYKYVLNSILM